MSEKTWDKVMGTLFSFALLAGMLFILLVLVPMQREREAMAHEERMTAIEADCVEGGSNE